MSWYPYGTVDYLEVHSTETNVSYSNKTFDLVQFHIG
jgi:hypothetical protein